MADELAGAVAVVVGAGSSGEAVSNGEAAARTFAAEGAAVLAVDRDGAEAERVAALVEAAGGRAVAVRADATDPEAMSRVVRRCLADLGPPSVLHNNVGLARLGGLEDLDAGDWDRALSVNLLSAVVACRAVVPVMVAHGGGSVVNVSSVASTRSTGYDYLAYGVAKAALNRLTAGLALEYADRGVRVNAVLPGLIDTPMARRLHAEQGGGDLSARDAASPTGAMGTVWDVANAALFLASPRAAYVSGVCLPVDGGLSARAG
ncbi:SDR family NAD(P)-dependent oxidoreductase [Phycicoccus avicenniae]|uniref:SDR family NAD(P)-dependent oxidoreductase n=1 Tax=Phycicoccus avicenniae TaxID=2828860 RepID=UPI003D2659D6